MAPSFLTTLDLACGYWQIELDEESKPKTAFTYEAGAWTLWKVDSFKICST
jgi:hypothetical protein